MNLRHSKVTDWGLSHVVVDSRDTILDVGCGGGRTIRKLAAIATRGKVYGIDHSEASVAASRKTNRRSIALGRVEVLRGSVSQLPFPDGTFDLVTAVETHFFWPDLPGDMKEVRRVLKPGGRLLIVAEAYQGGKHGDRLRRVAELIQMTLLTVDEHRDLFVSAGFADVQIDELFDKGWICGLGRKPS